ncbi:hypothetical protein DFS33DRAFT_1378273 [Desarmillaria ectypa]|nr:hypothetical protein DFS33DRAFT_1378273 [Desarmillaria ectypa]
MPAKIKELELKDTTSSLLKQMNRHLRFLSRKAKSSSNSWTYGLLRVEDLRVVLADGTCSVLLDNTAIKATRSDIPPSLPGFTVLSEKRKSADIIFVAGGLIFGTLLTPQVPNNYTDISKADEWITSDIDLYIYGHNAKQANDKIRRIEKVYKSNLPSGSSFLVSKKRVQIVLKLVNSPREVLLNFDLDVCAAGYNGANVCMLPRFGVSLHSTSIFFLDPINEHYLGDRKATHDPRVFKYASKGHGIRILPSYQSALAALLEGPDNEIANVDGQVYKQFILLGHKNYPLYWENASRQGQKYRPIKTDSTIPVFTHALLENNMQRSSEPLGRSCLTGFSLFMRHIALWEEEVEGKIVVYDKYWAENTYGNGFAHSSYDDSPEYEWNESFNLEDFGASIDSFNDRESKGFTEAYEPIEWSRNDPIRISTAARVTYGASVDKVLSKEKDIHIPLILEKKFVEYANIMVLKALEEAGIKDCLPPLQAIRANDSDEERAFMWRLNDVLNWQMIDRRIDEIREMLWAFHQGNDQAQYEERICHVMEQIPSAPFVQV